MSDLQQKLDGVVAQAGERIPRESLRTMAKATAELKSSGIETSALSKGETAPTFVLKSQDGDERALEAMLAEGPLVLSFYRGGW